MYDSEAHSDEMVAGDIDYRGYYMYNEHTDIVVDDDYIVTFNVGGTIIQTLLSTVLYSNASVPGLINDAFLARHWDEEKDQYFFDRDPEAFRVVLNYMRTGTLHLPNHMCSPIISTELKFWGIDVQKIESCCWNNYSTGVQSLSNLAKLERDRRPMYKYPEEKIEHVNKWEIWKHWVHCLVYKQHTKWGKRYSYISFSIVILSQIVYSLQTVSYSESMHQIFYPHHFDAMWGADNATIRADIDLDYYAEHYECIVQRLDFFCLIFFSVEFIVIFVTYPSTAAFFKNTLMLVEVMILVPDYIFLANPDFLGNNVAKNMLKTFRLLRIVRTLRRVAGMYIMMYTLRASMNEIAVILGIICVATFFFSSLIYYFGDRETFDSIPIGCWWAIMTLTTVGYGDIVPKTALGRLIGCACAVLGALLLGLTIPSLIKNFFSMYFNIKFMMYKEKEFLRVYDQNHSDAIFGAQITPTESLEDELVAKKRCCGCLRRHEEEIDVVQGMAHIAEVEAEVIAMECASREVEVMGEVEVRVSDYDNPEGASEAAKKVGASGAAKKEGTSGTEKVTKV